jgi:hypothetical protein
MLRLLLPLSAAMLLLPAPLAHARPDPLNPRAEVPPPRLPTALRDHRPAITPEPGGWREANDKVTRIGGWKAYLREAQQPDAPALAAGAAASAPSTAPSRPAAAPTAASAPTPGRGGHAHGHR